MIPHNPKNEINQTHAERNRWNLWFESLNEHPWHSKLPLHELNAKMLSEIPRNPDEPVGMVLNKNVYLKEKFELITDIVHEFYGRYGYIHVDLIQGFILELRNYFKLNT